MVNAAKVGKVAVTGKAAGQLLQGCWRAHYCDDSDHAGGTPSSNDVLQHFDQRAACIAMKASASHALPERTRMQGTRHLLHWCSVYMSC